MSGDERASITQKYLRRWPDSKLAKSWAGKLVHIQTENGVWRVNGKGYTYAGTPDAWVLPFEEAQGRVNHCGPEKRTAFIAAVPPEPSQPDRIEQLERQLAEALRVHRWSLDQSGAETLAVCRGEHDKADGCNWEAWVPLERAEAAERQLATARTDALEEAAKLIEEGYSRDGITTKHDKCPHGLYGWEDCEQCAVRAIRSLQSEEGKP